jgi:pimeloyl-ACP methyl ester carboxylesterase
MTKSRNKNNSAHLMTLSKIAFAALALLLVILLAGLALIWAPDKPVEELVPKWAPAPSTFIEVDGMKVHVRDEGRRDDPSPILLLHGAPSSLHTWDGWAAHLRKEHRVIRVDLPGFGLTGPNPAHRYDIGFYTGFVADLMRALKVQRVVLVGNSFGGYVAWKTAVDYPDRVSKLVLIDAAGYTNTPTSVPLALRLTRMPALAPLLKHVLTRNTVASSVRYVYGDPTKVTPELVERYYDLTLRAGNREALGERARQVPLGEYEAQIKRVDRPTLIMWGLKDRLIPVDHAVKFHHDIANSRVITFDMLGHVPHEEDPEATVKAVESFLAASDSPGQSPGGPVRQH